MNSKFILCLALLFPASAAHAQNPSPPTSPTTAEEGASPLPDIPTLMREVQAHQQQAEAVEKDYLYREVVRTEELDGKGGVKKTTTEEFDDFWVGGVSVRKLVKKDGKDLSPDEQKKESERIDKEVAKRQERRVKADAEGKETDPAGHDEITVSRLLELGSFTNPRREQINGRDTIVVDFAGNPKAKTRNAAESVIHDVAGTAWIDETDRALIRTEGHFVNPFKLGGGLLVNVKKDTSFSLQMRKVNNEVWLPEAIKGQGQARFLLFVNLNGRVEFRFGDYRKFKATSTILPGVNQVDEPKPTIPPDPNVP